MIAPVLKLGHFPHVCLKMCQLLREDVELKEERNENYDL